MNLGTFWCVLLAVSTGSAEQWRWPEAASVRIDTKIAFDQDLTDKKIKPNRQDDEAPFRQPIDTEGFYNRPPGSGRFPVRVEPHRSQAYQVDGHGIYPLKNDVQHMFHHDLGTPLIGSKLSEIGESCLSNGQRISQTQDGTLDSLQYCKCLTEPECNPRPNSEAACGVGKYLCCLKRPNKVTLQNSEFFNEVDDERPMLLPGNQNIARPFPPPPGSDQTGFFDLGHENLNHHYEQQQGVLVGPDGPTGIIGPQHSKPNVLTGPGGPTGIIGPAPIKDDGTRSESAQRGVLVGPGGPTGIIGPAYGRRPILVGPGGPTGIIGPVRGGRGGVLIGPGGPTGIIGPGYGRRNPGVLTGPGGPTGIIGPGRPFLVGPNGPTGQIGPQGYFG